MATSQFSPGNIIDGRYKLLNMLGEGSFAEAWLAWEETMLRKVVLKILKNNITRDELKRRFVAEAQIMATLADSSHPHHARVVRVYTVSSVHVDVFYMAMEYVDGGDLQYKMYYEKPSLHAALSMFLLILYGVQVAHERVLDGCPAPVVHRDIKPANILIAKSGEPKVADFGIAHANHRMTEVGVQAAEFGTRRGIRAGTLGYGPPEQWSDAASVDERGDIYALGVLLAMIIADFDPGNHGDRLLYDEDLQEEVLKGLPADIRGVIAKAVQAQRKYRYQNIREFIAAVQALIKAHPDTGEPAWTPRPGLDRPAATPTPRPPTPGEKSNRPATPATPPPDDPAPSATAIPDAPEEQVGHGVLWTEIGGDPDEAEQPEVSAPPFLQQPTESPPPAPRKRKTGWAIGAAALAILLTAGGVLAAWRGQAVVTEVPTEARPQVTPEPIETKAETHIVPTIPVIEPVVEPPPEVKIEAKAEVKPKTEVKPRIDSLMVEEPVTVTTVKIVGPRAITANDGDTVTLRGMVSLQEGATIGSVSLRWRGKDGIAQEASVKQNGENLSADIVATAAMGKEITCYFDVRLRGQPKAIKSSVVTITIE